MKKINIALAVIFLVFAVGNLLIVLSGDAGLVNYLALALCAFGAFANGYLAGV